MSEPINERFIDFRGIRLFLRERAGEGVPTIFVHGVPTHSAEWLRFLERCAGPAIAFDLPGFGRSGRPDPGQFDYSVGTYLRFVDGLTAELAPRGYNLVVHDWGVVAVAAAQHRPEAVKRLVVINGVPLDDGYRWHWVARIWRRRGLGEAFNAVGARFGSIGEALRLARPGRQRMPPEFVQMVEECWDAGARRAVLGLYRSADPEILAAAGEHLDRLSCPALVLWGVDDPYISARDGRIYVRRLPRAEFVEFERAGHWPWIDRPELIDRVVTFLEEPAASR
jgi:pimeloyl-ACP methyl ester carboxylesterase